ncbi:MAG: penicillin-binding protein family [Clostridiales bacterium]|nr:penicillin-binding protein family [Clostridiales bacterium]
MNPKTKAASGNAPKKKKQLSPSKKFTLTVLRILVILVVAISCAAAGILGGAIYGYIKTAAPIDAKDFNLKMSSFVYDNDGQEIALLKGDENRVWVDDKDIPQHVKDAFISLEDERFEQHKGVDYYGLMVAAFDKLTHPQRPMRGASTITMQVVKVTSGNDARSIQRKVQEQWAALQLEKQLSKWQILELYMNLVITGPNIYGVEAASKYYFNKDVQDLTIAEAASIAGITNNPSIYSPITTKGRENNKARQKIALGNMLRLGKITQAQYDKAITEELKFEEGTMKKTSKQSYFVDQVINDIRKDLMTQYNYTEQAANKIIFNGGIKIYSTQDMDVQKAMDEIYMDDKYFKVNQKLQERPQSAMVIIDPENGQVKAMYGGYGEKKADMILNRATQSKRQPGSTMKPIAIYGPALDSKVITAGTVYDDVPVYLNSSTPDKPYPQNYDFTYGGLTPIRDAIRQSINVVASQVFVDLGADQSLKYLKREGFDLDKRNDGNLAPLALGALTNGTNPLQLAAAYVPFVNKGMYTQPTTYSKVLDKDGKVLLEKKQKKNLVYDNEATSYIMTDMLKGVVTNGTAYPYGTVKNANGQTIPTAGKTGTTSDNIDKWFVGYSKYYVGATWYGYDNKGSKPTELQGEEREMALKIWNAVMNKVHKNLAPKEFERPSGIVEKNICYESGKIPTELCSQEPRGGDAVRYGELFLKGTEPQDSDVCDIHVRAKLDKNSLDAWGRQLLATPNTPQLSIVEKVLVKRKVPFTPKSTDDKYPKDWIYELPTEYSKLNNTVDAKTKDTTKSTTNSNDTTKSNDKP